jgi:diguanylate cyclase (GGDEF)-like protein/putative nucleotidyltransferase with HDIG domain
MRLDSARQRFTGAGAGPLARAEAYIGIGGALLGSLGVLLPHPEQFYVPGLVAMQIATIACALPLLIWADRMPLWVVRAVPALGTVLNTFAVVFSGDPTSAYALFYLWVGFYAFYFLSRSDAVLHISFAALNYVFAIALINSTSSPGTAGAGDVIHHLVITVGTLLISGMLLLYLRGHVERLMHALTDAARTDLLTGLRSRRGVREVAEREFERAKMHGRKLSLLIADLDHFTQINETLGQATGDRILQYVGQQLEDGTRRIDTVGRTGGEEFAVVVPEADLHYAFRLSEQLSGRIRRTYENGSVSLTMSVGVAAYPDHASDISGLFEAAEKALHAAKVLGRDRAVLFSPEIEGVLTGAGSRRWVDSQAHVVTVIKLAEALDLRDSSTARHSENVGRYAEVMARELGLPEDQVSRIRLAGILHDIGKVGVPDAILGKPGPLTDEEQREMRRHPEVGAQILGSGDLADISEWVLCSHERPDGRGYPRGLRLEEIPLEARIVSVADAYEAMTCDRVYRPGIGAEAAREELIRGAGTQFDREVVDAFIRVLDRDEVAVEAPS